jgi:hypothetical protein
MTFSKERATGLLMVFFSIFLIVQQIAIRYGRWHRFRAEKTETARERDLAMHEISQLQNIWRKAAVGDIITPQKLANPTELKQTRARLEEAAIEIQNSKKRIQESVGENHEFFQKAYTYYHQSASVLLKIIDFLLAKEGKFSVNENEINFDSDSDAGRFRELLNHLSHLHQEKQNLDAFILHHNKERTGKLSA